MGIEILVCISLLCTGLLTGYIVATQMQEAKKAIDFLQKAEALNANLASFGKAYEDFVMRCIDIDQRLGSMEFKVNGFVNKK